MKDWIKRVSAPWTEPALPQPQNWIVPKAQFLEARIWYYLKAGQPVGAFTYPEMIKNLQQKKVAISSVVWRQGMLEWAPLLTVAELQPKTIKKIFQENLPLLQGAFSPRKHKRIDYAAQFVVHNQRHLWRAISFEIGAGGLGIIADTTEIPTGVEVFIHKVSITSGPSINAIVRVVSKSIHGLRPGQARYGLEFVDIAAQSQREIMDFADAFC